MTPAYRHTISNGARVEKTIHLPGKLWIELADEWANSRLRYTKGMDIQTAFAAGLAVGWAEHEKGVK